MPRILTRCPNSGETVPTGHRTPSFDLAAMTETRAFRCASCGKVHDWASQDAWEEEGLTPSAMRAAIAAN